MLSKMPRPSRTASTMVLKLSSARIILALCLVTSVPVMPIATPMSAVLTAGASFTPSPVIATILPCRCSDSTIFSLCSGATRAYTEISRVALSNARSSGSSSSWTPVSTLPLKSSAPAALPFRSVSMMPRSLAMRAAVSGWSPVIMTVRMLARCASATESRTSVRGGSMMPTIPTQIKSLSSTSLWSAMSAT